MSLGLHPAQLFTPIGKNRTPEILIANYRNLSEMELAASLLSRLVLPTAAFHEIKASNDSDNKPLIHEVSIPWEQSTLNPSSRVDSLLPVQRPRWRIDGCSDFGRQFQVVPMHLLPDLSPNRIDLYVPDQLAYPLHLRDVLQSSSSFYLGDKRVAFLPISHHILQALENWIDNTPDFESSYRDSPFGSRIVLENVATTPQDMRIHLLPVYDLERSFLSVEALQSQWNLPVEAWPKSVDLASLQLVSQIHDTISLVTTRDSTDITVFKSTAGSLKYLYHELKTLLLIPPHPNIIARPLNVVTKPSRYGGKDVVCGFILKYYPSGTLRDVLAFKAITGCLSATLQLKWARQIVSALMHIGRCDAQYYSELKPDNILLTSPEDGEDLILVDFEQRGNWRQFTAPEISYLEYLEYLAHSKEVAAITSRYTELWKKYTNSGAQTKKGCENTEHSYFYAWTSLSAREQESAEVFSLGKLLYCIFEGVGCISNIPTRAYRYESNLEFPEFRNTPAAMRDCIKNTTRGATEWKRPLLGIYRNGDKVYPRGKTGLNGQPFGTATEAQEAAKRSWQLELQDMEQFLEIRARCARGLQSEEDEDWMSFMVRPSLEDVLESLRVFGETI